MANKFRFNYLYQPVFTTKCRYIDIWGGRGAGRSFFGTEYFLFLITRKTYFRGCFLRNVFGDIRDSLFQDFKDRIEESNYDERLFEIDESKMTIKFKPTGNTIISKGFKKASGNRTAKLKSLAGITHVLLEEADENNESDVNKLDDSIRTNKIENIQVIMLHNSPSKNHWITKRFYRLRLTGIKDPETGKDIPYYKAEKKPGLDDVLMIFSTYLDNIENLNANTIHKYKEYGRKESPFYNEEHYYTDVMGLIPEGAKGRIYRDWIHIPDAFYDSLPYEEYFGLDFGYSGDPVALVGVKSHNNRNFFKEYIYEPDLTNPALAEKMVAMKIPYNATIYADSAEPKSIQELKDLGFKQVKEAEKGSDSVLYGINKLKSMENFITDGSKNGWNENEEYKWQLSSTGEPLDKPVKGNDHFKDAARYAVVTRRFSKRKNKTTVANTTTEGGEQPAANTNLLDYV